MSQTTLDADWLEFPTTKSCMAWECFTTSENDQYTEVMLAWPFYTRK